MPFTQIIDYTDADTPINFRKFSKKIHNGIEWEDVIFYEIKDNQRNAKEWLQEKYGYPCYCKSWWETHTSVVMSEKVYTHYALSV